MLLPCRWGMAPLIVLLIVASSPGAEKDEKWSRLLDPRYHREKLTKTMKTLQKLEAMEMLSALLKGGNMGPGQGWFHPGKSRYNWDWLAKKFDANEDGRITPKELKGSPLFKDLDRDGSGAVTRDDFDWSNRSRYVQELGMAKQWLGRVDKGSNGRITPDEWKEFFDRASQGKGYLTPEDLRKALIARPPRPARPLQPKGNKPSRGGPPLGMLINGMLTGEIGSMREGPGINECAPDFTLKTREGKPISLEQLKKKNKPVVLIFGSFT